VVAPSNGNEERQKDVEKGVKKMINEKVTTFIAQLKKCDLHVHMGGACTKEFF